MGRYATEVPTPADVGRAIARLKPKKREQWRQDASERGWRFEAYVIARIMRNVEHREGLEAGSKAGSGSLSPAQDSHTKGGADLLENASTQQLEGELARRKRRRRESTSESPAKRCPQAEDDTDLPKVQHHGVFRDAEPTLPEKSRALGQRSDSFLVHPFEPSQEVPPSGGEAARADRSFERVSSYVTAHDFDDDASTVSTIHWSQDSSPPTTPPPEKEAGPASDSTNSGPETQYSGPETQDLQLLLESTQVRKVDKPAQYSTARTHLDVSTSPTEKPPLPAAQDQERQFEADVKPAIHWNFNVKDVPPHSTTLWCVRHGLVPGFHFQEPWMPDLSQSRTFPNMCYQIFELVGRRLDAVIAEGIEYMNHLPKDCKPSYNMCYLTCINRQRTISDLKTMRQRHPPMEPWSPPAKDVERRCDVCDALVNDRKAVLCQTCAFGPQPDPDLTLATNMFQLCEEQVELLKLTSQGHNVFYTGAAGTGKSTVLRSMVYYLTRKHFRGKRLEVEVLSPTGITALNIGGKTIHMFAGWTAKSEEYSIKHLRRHAQGLRNWERLTTPDVLIIDEISMVSNFMLTRLDQIMRAARHQEDLPFGGVQLVITGDFFQLPPVKPFRTCLTCGLEMEGLHEMPTPTFTCVKHGTFTKNQQWAFASNVWTECHFRCIELQQIHRQGDRNFSTLLNRIRIGIPLLDADYDRLMRPDPGFEDDKAVRIYPFRTKVAAENERELERLKGDASSLRCIDGQQWNEDYIRS